MMRLLQGNTRAEEAVLAVLNTSAKNTADIDQKGISTMRRSRNTNTVGDRVASSKMRRVFHLQQQTLTKRPPK
jgi:hypothetical protein